MVTVSRKTPHNNAEFTRSGFEAKFLSTLKGEGPADMIGTVKHHGVVILGNCCTHGEFVAAALHQEPEAKIIAGWEEDPGRKQGLSDAIGMALKKRVRNCLTIQRLRLLP